MQQLKNMHKEKTNNLSYAKLSNNLIDIEEISNNST